MKYYKYPEHYSSPLPEGMTYLETVNGSAIRQITIQASQTLSSNVKDPVWGFHLLEHQYDYDHLSDVEQIPKEEFDRVWQLHLTQNEKKWRQIKFLFTVGVHVAGHIEVFFPQGTIVNLGNDIIAVANYEECRASTQPKFLYPRHKVTAVVIGYDEQNQWVVLGSPQVHEEEISVIK